MFGLLESVVENGYKLFVVLGPELARLAVARDAQQRVSRLDASLKSVARDLADED